jgi:parallel beta-helix repeat protein
MVLEHPPMHMKRIILFLTAILACATLIGDQAGRKYPENELHARPAIRVSVGRQNADVIGSDNRALQAAVDYVGNLGGGVVEVGPGEYLMRDSLHLRSRVTVRGRGLAILKKDREYRSELAADSDFGEAAIIVKETDGFEIGRGVYVGSSRQRNFHGSCATILNGRSNYFTLTRSMNADIMMDDGGFACTTYPVISGYHLEDARLENLAIDGNLSENPTKVDGCRVAGIFLYRGDHCVVTNCTVRDYNGDGISFQQSNDVRVDNCLVERCAGLGLHPGSGSQRPSIVNCRAVANGDDGLFFCWRVRGGVAEGNWLEGNRGYGISIGHKDSDNFVRGNTIIGNQRGGVLWRAETEPMAAHRVTFENNVVRDNDGAGLFVNGFTRGTIIRNNTIEDSGEGRQKTGIRVGKHVRDLVIQDNTIKAQITVMDDRSE